MIGFLPYFLLGLILLVTSCTTELKPTSTTMVMNVTATATPAAAFTPSSTPMPTATPTIQPTREPLTVTPSSTIVSTPTVENQLCETTDEGVTCSVDFHTVTMWDAQTGWIFGDKGVVLRYDIAPGENTPSWQPDNNLPEPYPLAAFSPVSPRDGWGISGYLVRYQDGQWTSTAEIEGVELRDIIMLTASEGWSVGRDVSKERIPWDGLIFRYTNDEWSKVFTSPSEPLLAIDMLNNEVGWGVGGIDGIVVRYRDQQWEQLNPTLNGSHSFLDVDVVSEEEVWIVGDRIILHYKEGDWTEVVPDLAENLFDPVIDMVNAEEGWIVGRNGYMLHYQNGQWQEVDSPTENDLLSISMVSAEEGWAVGRNGTILHYQNGVWELVSEAP